MFLCCAVLMYHSWGIAYLIPQKKWSICGYRQQVSTQQHGACHDYVMWAPVGLLDLDCEYLCVHTC